MKTHTKISFIDVFKKFKTVTNFTPIYIDIQKDRNYGKRFSIDILGIMNDIEFNTSFFEFDYWHKMQLRISLLFFIKITVYLKK